MCMDESDGGAVGLGVVPARSSARQQARPPLNFRQSDGDLTTWSVRILKKDDWALLRDVRIRALDTSSDSLAGDLATVSRLKEDQWRDQIRRREWFVVLSAGQPIAVAALNKSALTDPGECSVINEPHAHIESIWVEPKFRNKRIAHTLVTAAKEEVRRDFKKCSLIGLWVFENNKRGADTFRSMGFERSAPHCQEYRGESRRERRRPPRLEYHMHLPLEGTIGGASRINWDS